MLAAGGFLATAQKVDPIKQSQSNFKIQHIKIAPNKLKKDKFNFDQRYIFSMQNVAAVFCFILVAFGIFSTSSAQVSIQCFCLILNACDLLALSR